MYLILYAAAVLIAFVMGMAAYHDIHVVYMKRAKARERRRRDHRKCWCQCSVI